MLTVYANTERMPKSEEFGLKAQIRRASVSAASNLAEGMGRGSSYAELDRFCAIAAGSVAEVEYQAFLCLELNFITPEEYGSIKGAVNTCQRRLVGFRKWLKSRRS